MRIAGRSWQQLLVLLTAVYCSLCQDALYNVLYTASQGTVGGIYDTLPAPSLVQCAQVCRPNWECAIFAYDDTTRQCRVFTSVTYSPPIAVSSPTHTTYGLQLDPGMKYKILDVPMEWNEGYARCQQLGGSLTMPRTQSEIAVLHHRVSFHDFFIGASRRNASSPWLYLDGTEVDSERTPWHRDHPMSIAKYDCIGVFYTELFSMLCTTQTRMVVCRVPYL